PLHDQGLALNRARTVGMVAKLVWTLPQVGAAVMGSVPGASHPDQASKTPRKFGVATRSTTAPSGRANKQRTTLSGKSKPVPPLVSTVSGIVQEIVVGVAILLVPLIVPPGQRANKP